MKDLKNGFTLVSLYEGIRNAYSYLYKEGVKISDEIFRAGGLCFGYKGEYCMLIQYDAGQDGFSYGTHVIVDRNGDIVFKQGSGLEYPYLLGGCIVGMNGRYYNLKTGNMIVNGNRTIDSEKFLFVENSYNDEFEKGVYKIDYETGEYEIFE